MSNSQKYIKIISILNIIGGAIQIAVGCLALLGVGMAGTDALVQETGDASAPFAAAGFIIALAVAGGFSVLCGVLGLRAAKDASKIGPVLILAGLSLAVAAIGLVANIVNGNFAIANLTELIAPGLMLWCANNVKNQA